MGNELQPEYVTIAIALESHVAETHKFCELIKERLYFLYNISEPKSESVVKAPQETLDGGKDMASRLKVQLRELASANEKLQQIANHFQKII